jgi:tetratricopeptide (TPR) repeat protein/SAM-dependent methyltransferase
MHRKERRAAGKRASSFGAASPTAALFALAAQHHEAGQLVEAENLYRQVLALDRNHFRSLHHLGMIALQRGQPQAAVEVLNRALAVDARVADCHYNLAFALNALGRPSDAVAHYREAARLKPDYVEAHTNLGNVLMQLGRSAEAATCYERVIALKPSAEAHYNLANTLSRLGRLGDAIAQYRRALALKADLVGAHNNLANALVAHGLADDALSHFEAALKLDPTLVEAHVNLGTTLLQQGNTQAAAARFERALAISPNFADAHANLGNALLADGRLEEAAQCYERALALKPELSEAHNNLGIVLAARGAFAEAAQRFQRALAAKPDFIDAYNNLARAFLSMGQPDHALGALRRALAITETEGTKALFVQCVQALPVPPDVDDFRALMLRALAEPWGRANDLGPVAARLIKQDPTISGVLRRVMETWPRRLSADALLDAAGLAAFSGNRLLHCLMQSAAISDIGAERLLTAVRCAMLERAAKPDSSSAASQAMTDFCCALARQCFLNEQVFALTDEELVRAQQLRDTIAAAVASGAPVAEFQLAVVASYFPLHTLTGAQKLLDRSWSAAMTEVVEQQVREPAQEQETRAAIPALTTVDDEVSRQVREQYEQNPYPRWTKAEPARAPLMFDEYLRRKLPASLFRKLGKAEIDVLIAGCGTGQHAIETAQRFAGAKVLALDLSLTSIAYALRKTRALGRRNLEYGQADILKLGSLGRSFDVIESSGVLHHLGDPLAGWRVLVSLLRPGGFMAVGLYSALARAQIVEARAFIAERGYRSTAEDIRRCRQALFDEPRFKEITTSGDFFSTSGCRDLLFHVQEHRLTIPQIAEFLAENGLSFVGFDLDHATPQKYLQRFPQDKAMTDLSCWHAFEREHPHTFAGMYQFWVQKA